MYAAAPLSIRFEGAAQLPLPPQTPSKTRIKETWLKKPKGASQTYGPSPRFPSTSHNHREPSTKYLNKLGKLALATINAPSVSQIYGLNPLFLHLLTTSSVCAPHLLIFIRSSKLGVTHRRDRGGRGVVRNPTGCGIVETQTSPRR